MDWTAGYASDIEYTAGFYREQSPTYLNFACVLNGIEPVSLDKPFTYFELGFGRGLTVNVLAASNPQGKFYATDFNPAHVAGAQALADSAGLTNLTLLENSFADLAEGKVSNIPPLDFITLHGIYTWVTPENRAHIVTFIHRYLKPGGIVYVSYNAMPGWAATLPLQRLLIEHSTLSANSSEIQVKQGSSFVEKMAEMKAGYFSDNAILKHRLESLKTGSAQYLVHEYMHRHWEPLYHVDVARDFRMAKLDFVGSADLAFAYPSLYLQKEKQELLNTISDTSLRETFKDYFLNTAFRKDIFSRGGRRMVPGRQLEWLSKLGLTLIIPREDAVLNLKLPFGEVAGKEDLFIPVLDAIAKQPRTLPELAALPALAHQTPAKLAQVAALLTVTSQTSIYIDGGGATSKDSSSKLNQAIANTTRHSDEYQFFASSKIGSGIPLNFIERLVFLVITQQQKLPELDVIRQKVWEYMKNQSRRLVKDGHTIESEEENLIELNISINDILQRKLPIWRQLKLM